MSDAYAAAGVDTDEAGRGLRALVSVLARIDTGKPSRSVLGSGHYANVLRVADNLGIALSTDGVGSKLVLAEQTGRLDTVGVDCIAMNVNDVVCVGAEPIAVLDYLAVERVDPAAMEQIAIGLRRGAELAGVEIPGGELAVLPEVIRGHPSPHGFDLCGACVGTVALDRIVTGETCAPGDVMIGLPSSGLHSNGYTLARRIVAEAGIELGSRPEQLGGGTLADGLLEPTVIYVRAVLELLESCGARVHGLAHITGDGVLNLLRLGAGSVGFEISSPLPPAPVCTLVAELGGIAPAEAHVVFNMGCGFVAIVAPDAREEALAILSAHHAGAAEIGVVTEAGGVVTMPPLGIGGDARGLRAL